MSRRHQDWQEQARRDLKAAIDSATNENFEWACFQAQQAAEKSLKALLRFHHMEPKGHTLVQLLASARQFLPIPDNMDSAARELDRHYIQSRYPNGFAAGYPGEYYDRSTAESAIERARFILAFAEDNAK